MAKLLRSPKILTGLCLSGVFGILAIIGPLIAPYNPNTSVSTTNGTPMPPSAAHWLGTDRLGRDLLVRTLCGVRLSLVLAVLASTVSLLLGVLWGAVAGLAGGRVDGAMMRFVDVLYSLPYLFVVIILTKIGRAHV